MGQVYRAHDLQLDVPVAVKVVRPELGRDPLFRQLFEREVRAAARLAHPAIVPIHDTGELSNGSPYLALALADGGSQQLLSCAGAAVQKYEFGPVPTKRERLHADIQATTSRASTSTSTSDISSSIVSSSVGLSLSSVSVYA
jgi:hypothetical protein